MTKEEAIEQEPKVNILNKIKTELLDNAEMHEDGDYYIRDKWVSEIIDKYGEQEQKVGHWIENEKQTHIEKIYHCSECGFKAWGKCECTNYCGGCGCRMGEVSE